MIDDMYAHLPNEAECLRADAEALVRDRTRKRVIERMAAQIERELYPSAPSEADQAQAYVKGFAQDLATAASALKSAAERLKKKGDSYGARTTYTAALQAEAQVKALLGEEP